MNGCGIEARSERKVRVGKAIAEYCLHKFWASREETKRINTMIAGGIHKIEGKVCVPMCVYMEGS
jgi:hypothetical protein